MILIGATRCKYLEQCLKTVQDRLAGKAPARQSRLLQVNSLLTPIPGFDRQETG